MDDPHSLSKVDEPVAEPLNLIAPSEVDPVWEIVLLGPGADITLPES